MVDNRDPLFREIDEELRREQITKLWNEYGTYVILAVALLIVGVGGFKWWEAKRVADAQAAGSRFQAVLELIDQGKADQAQQELRALAEQGGAGYAALARLQLAAAAAKAGKSADALATYEQLSNDKSADSILRQYAQLQAAALRLGSASWTEMQNRLTPLLGDKAPWRYSARELLGLAAYRNGQIDEARKVLIELVGDQKAPASIRERAGILMGLIAVADTGNSAAPGSDVQRGGSGAGGAGGSTGTKAQ